MSRPVCCANCAYAKQLYAMSGAALEHHFECRRMPKAPGLPVPPYFTWPSVQGDDWCGEWALDEGWRRNADDAQLVSSGRV